MDPYLRIASLEADYEKLSSAYRQSNQEVQELRIGTQQLHVRVKELESELHTVWANVAKMKQQLATAAAVYTELREALTAEIAEARRDQLEIEALTAERDRLHRVNTELHKAIEEFWVKQCGEHACGCGEWPECTHTFNAAMLRKAAMALDEPAENGETK